MIMRSLCAAAVVASCATTVSSSAATQTGFLFKTLELNKHDYPYVVYVPRNYDSTKPWPLILFLHGAGKCGTDGCQPVTAGLGTAIIAESGKWPFIVVMPQKPEVQSTWEQYDDVVMAMLKQVRKDYKVDSARLYLTGASQGGHGTWVLGAKHADTWAAIAPVCGYGGTLWPVNDIKPGRLPAFNGPDSELAEQLKNVPVWAFHGEADPVVPIAQSKGLVAAVQAVGGNAKLTTYPGVEHNSWDKAYGTESLGNWFLSHTKPAE